MKLRKISLLISILAMGGVNSAHAALTCTLNRVVTGASASGTLTVNTIGSVAAANITAWNITVTVNTSTGSLTQSNSTLNLGTNPPTIASTANSLTITPVPMVSLSSGQTSLFHFYIGGSTQYSLTNDANMAPPSSYESFIPVGVMSSDKVYNSPPASLNLTCTCATDVNVTCPSPPPPVSASVDLISNKQPETYSEEISIK